MVFQEQAIEPEAYVNASASKDKASTVEVEQPSLEGLAGNRAETRPAPPQSAPQSHSPSSPAEEPTTVSTIRALQPIALT